MKKRRKIGRGKLLEELTKGSYNYTISRIRTAFRAQFPRNYDSEPYRYVEEVFDGYVIVQSGELAPDEYYYVTYESNNGEYVFAGRDDWEVVELSYKPVSRMDEGQKFKRKRFDEIVFTGGVVLEEAKPGQPRYITGYGVTADEINGNARRYPTSVLVAALDRANEHLHESFGQGRIGIIPIVGEAEHPSTKNQRPQFLETIVKWEELGLDDSNRVRIRGRIIETSKGRDAIAIMESGIFPAISQRGYGASKMVEIDGRTVEEVTALTITGYDLLAAGEQSDPNGYITMLEQKDKEDRKVNIQEILEALQESGFFDTLTGQVQQQVEAALAGRDAQVQERALREALGIGPDDDINAAVLARLGELQKPTRVEGGELDPVLRESLGLTDTDNVIESIEERMERLAELEVEALNRQVREYVETQVGALTYPAELKKTLTEAILAAGPQSVEASKKLIVEKRKEYDAIMAQVQLTNQGYGGGLRMGGPVIESELGIPAYAIAGWELQESLMRTGRAHQWDHRKPRSINEMFTVRYLERFDQIYRPQLIAEARRYEEAETTTDLNLPYSVSRAIIAEAFPMLVATSIYDVGTVDISPFRMYFEYFTGESGYTVTVTDEAVTADHDTWVDMAGARVTPGTVVVTNSGATVTYVEGTDYTIHYTNGQLKALSSGSITDAQSLLVDYAYTAIRKGEMSPIERGKKTMLYKTYDAVADRLADQISKEAIVFGRSQLGWDATTQTMMNLVREVRRKIDQGMLYQGLSAALEVANNIAGTWISATDDLDLLVKYIGQAKVLVHNRYYEPTAVIASVTNADLLSNWDGFRRDGFPDAVLNTTGFVGRIKGLPLYESTEFSDGYIEVVNQQLVMYRVFQPMTIFGPYPSYDPSTMKLIAADQYYCEEFNITDSPIPEKGALVKIV